MGVKISPKHLPSLVAPTIEGAVSETSISASFCMDWWLFPPKTSRAFSYMAPWPWSSTSSSPCCWDGDKSASHHCGRFAQTLGFESRSIRRPVSGPSIWHLRKKHGTSEVNHIWLFNVLCDYIEGHASCCTGFWWDTLIILMSELFHKNWMKQWQDRRNMMNILFGL